MAVLVPDVLDKVCHPLVDVVVFQVGVVFDGLVVAQEVETEAGRRAVIVEQDAGEQTLLVVPIDAVVACETVSVSGFFIIIGEIL